MLHNPPVRVSQITWNEGLVCAALNAFAILVAHNRNYDNRMREIYFAILQLDVFVVLFLNVRRF